MPGCDKTVAVKIVHGGPSAGSDAGSSAEREALDHARVSGHPNVVRMHASFRHFDRFYMVTELMGGGDLRCAIPHGSRGLRDAAARQVAVQVASALQHMHRRGVAHSDLKPENLLLASRFDAAGGNTIKIADLGRASTFTRRDARRGRVCVRDGTFVYMSPEALRREPHDPAKSDSYSLGVVLYELVVGTRPYADPASDAGDRQAHLRTRTRMIDFSTHHWAAVSTELKSVVVDLLDDDWRRRPSPAQVISRLS